MLVVFDQKNSLLLNLFGAGVFSDGFGSLRNGVFSQFARQQESHRGLNLTRRNCRSTVVIGQSRGLRSDALEDIIDERVHDAHRFRRDTSVWVNLLQHFVDVDRVGLLSSALSLALAFSSLGWLHGFLRSFRRNFWCHYVRICL